MIIVLGSTFNNIEINIDYANPRKEICLSFEASLLRILRAKDASQ
jgi:hypothetical protein